MPFFLQHCKKLEVDLMSWVAVWSRSML